MKSKISQETITPITPITAIVKVEEAAAAFLESPPEVRYLNPPTMNIAKKANPAAPTII